MGIYIFTWSKLKKYLEEDEANPESENDFGKNVIPAMLQNGERMYAYAFQGYWKDVGTIDSLWEANMDLLDPNVPLDLYDDAWKIYARNPVMPPQYVAEGAVTQNSMISEGCIVEGDVDFSILFAGVTVEKGAVVHDSIIMPGSVIKAGAVVEYSIVAEMLWLVKMHRWATDRKILRTKQIGVLPLLQRASISERMQRFLQKP